MTHEEILADMARTYRLYRRKQLSLLKPPFTRVFKNHQCKTAIKLAEKREEIEEDIDDLWNGLYRLWFKLPEVRQEQLKFETKGMEFISSLAKRKRRPKYLKNQRQFAATAPVEVAISPAGAGDALFP